MMADGTENFLTSAASFADTTTENAANAALFSTADLTVGGTGSLWVTAPSLDGITAKDGLVINSGAITVTAADDGIRGKDHLVVAGGTITVTAGGDGLKSDQDAEADQGYSDIAGGNIGVTAAGDG